MFDKLEWQVEVGKKDGDDWVLFSGRPVLEFCDIRLKDGREIGPCWPKTVRELVFVDLSSDDEAIVPFSDVTHVKYYEDADQGDTEEVDECEDDEA